MTEIPQDLTGRAGDVPDPEIINAAVEVKIGAAANAQVINTAQKRRHAALGHEQITVRVNGHVVAALTGNQGIVHPVADGVRRRGGPNPSAGVNVAEVPVGVAVEIADVGIESVRGIIRLQHEGRLLAVIVGFGPEFHRDFIGR